MPLLGGADEVGIGDVQFLPQGLVPLHHTVSQFQRGLACRVRGLLHFLAVLVGPGEKEHLPALEVHVTGKDIRGQRGIGMP